MSFFYRFFAFLINAYIVYICLSAIALFFFWGYIFHETFKPKTHLNYEYNSLGEPFPKGTHSDRGTLVNSKGEAVTYHHWKNDYIYLAIGSKEEKLYYRYVSFHRLEEANYNLILKKSDSKIKPEDFLPKDQ